MLAFVDVLAEEPQDLAELSPEEIAAAGARVCDDVLLRHKIMEQFTGLNAELPQKVIRSLTERLLAKYKAEGSVACRSMLDGLRLVSDMIDFTNSKSVDGRLLAGIVAFCFVVSFFAYSLLCSNTSTRTHICALFYTPAPSPKKNSVRVCYFACENAVFASCSLCGFF